MKVLFKKNMPNALIISVGLHILLLLTLGTLYRQKSDLDVKPVTEFDIIRGPFAECFASSKKISPFFLTTRGTY